ncbi:MAG: TolC family protein [Sedimentisphaerales bacterium]
MRTNTKYMLCNNFTKQLAYLIIFGLVCLCSLAGCTQHNYKKEADEKVYNIIDEKWQKDFGTKVNYKISDTAPAPNDIQIEKAVPTSGVLSLSQAVALATAHNREYQTQKEALYIKALDLSLTRHEFERQFFVGAGGGYSTDRNDAVLGIEANFGFNQLLANGARIGANLAATWADVLTGNLRGGLSSLLNITITQPLLRGSERRVVLENLTQAERNTLYEVRLFNRFRKTFVVSIISQYYGVLQQHDEVQNAWRNYNSLSQVYERVEKLANAGRVPQFELDRVRQDKLQALDTCIQAEKGYKQALDEFKIALSLRTTVEFQLDDSELEALRAAEMTEPDFAEAEAIETALLRRLDLANNADAVIDAQRKVFVAADSLRAELNLVRSANAISARRANRQTLGWLREEYDIDLELDLPLDRVPEQHVYRKALITLNQRQREYDQAADMVRLQVRRAYRDLTEAAERYKVQLEGLKLAEKRFNNTFLLLQYGRANSRRVLSAQDDLFDAQNASTRALVDYTIATLKFYRDTEVLHVRPDGMWER